MTEFHSNRRSFLKRASAAAAITSLAEIGFSSPLLASTEVVPKSSNRFRFAVASDGHFGQPETNYQQYFENMIRWLTEEKTANGLDLAIFNGDLIHDNPAFLPQVKAYFDKLPCPYYVTRGNHDRVSEAVWKATWGYSFNHDITVGNYAFILGDTSNEVGEFLCVDIDWLTKRLNQYAQKKHVFVFLHIPQELWTKNGVDCLDLRKTIARFPQVTAIFHGHDHEQDGSYQSEGKPYFFDGHMGGNWGTAYKGYRIVEIDTHEKVKTYQYNPEAKPIVNTAQLPAK